MTRGSTTTASNASGWTMPYTGRQRPGGTTRSVPTNLKSTCSPRPPARSPSITAPTTSGTNSSSSIPVASCTRTARGSAPVTSACSTTRTSTTKGARCVNGPSVCNSSNPRTPYGSPPRPNRKPSNTSAVNSFAKWNGPPSPKSAPVAPPPPPNTATVVERSSASA